MIIVVRFERAIPTFLTCIPFPAHPRSVKKEGKEERDEWERGNKVGVGEKKRVEERLEQRKRKGCKT